MVQLLMEDEKVFEIKITAHVCLSISVGGDDLTQALREAAMKRQFLHGALLERIDLLDEIRTEVTKATENGHEICAERLRNAELACQGECLSGIEKTVGSGDEMVGAPIQIVNDGDDVLADDGRMAESLTDALDLDEIRSECARNRRVDVDALIKTYGIVVVDESRNNNGGRIVKVQCPFTKDHVASILQSVTGIVNFHCFHNRCKGKGWGDVVALYESGGDGPA